MQKSRKRIVAGLLAGAALAASFAVARFCTRTAPTIPATQTTAPHAPQPVAAPPKHSRIIAGPKPTVDIPRRQDVHVWPQQPHAVALRHRALMPSRELNVAVGARDRLVWIAQFGGPLDADAIAELRKRNIDVLFPTVALAWHVRASHLALARAADFVTPRILGWERLFPADKLLPSINGTLTPVAGRRLELYPGADAAAVKTAVEAAGAQITSGGTSGGGGWLELRVAKPSRENDLALAALEDVYAVDLPRPALRGMNLQASDRSNITVVRGAPLNLTGSGIKVMVRDEGRVFSHPDFSGRLTLGPDTGALSPNQHASHVAGTIGGTGSINASAIGMAPGCSLLSFDLFGDDVGEPLFAKNSLGAVLSNHSYGFVTGWNSGIFNDNQITFGQYSSFARNWDAIIRSDNLIMIKAAGNDRNDTGTGFPHDGTLASDGDFYDTIDSSTTGKNILCVGSAADAAQAGTTSGTVQVLPSSSSGPCDDGRLRPEIIANGDALLSCNNSATAGSEYTALTGTSMSAAVVAGASALFLQRYQQKFGPTAFCPPYFLRALYAQTATDLGRPGPDFLHGYGMLNLSSAIALFDQDNGSGKRLVSNTLSSTVPERFYFLNSDGVNPVRATLCWNDDPGDLLAARALVNNLDLKLVRVSDQQEILPFALNSSLPSLPAFNAVNNVDTIEQVLLLAPSFGGYTLSVKGTALSSTTPFTLASSHDLVENLAPVAKLTASPLTGAPPLVVTLSAAGSFDPDDNLSQFLWDFGDGSSGSGILVQHTYAQGSYTATLKVVDDRGASAVAKVAIGVNNNPPNIVAGATPDAGLPPLALLFTAAGSTDSDGAIVDFNWDFGDGTSGKGAVISHTYPAPGLYFAKIKVTDNGGATAERMINVLVGITVTPASGRFGLNFKRIAADKFTVQLKGLPVDPALSPTGLGGSVIVGNADFPFTLSDKGKFNLSPLNIQFTPAKGTLRVTVSRTALDDALANSGAGNFDAKAQLLRVPFAVVFNNGTVFGSTGVSFSYTSKRGASGNGKLMK